MASRKCHLCDAYYTDEEGHDYDECVATLETRLKKASTFFGDVQTALAEATTVMNRRHQLHSSCDADITRLGNHIEKARKNLAELENDAVEAVSGLPFPTPVSMETTKWVLRSRLDGIREAIQAFKDAVK